jgi:hypothetical protein
VNDSCPCEAVGLKEIASRLGMDSASMRHLKWRHGKRRSYLSDPWQPLPEAQWGDRWCWPHQIVPWAERTGRL